MPRARKPLPPWRVPVVIMAATVGSYASALALAHVADLNSGVLVLAVVLAVTLGRTQHGAGVARLASVPVVAVLASEVARLALHHENIGDALFVVALGGGIWLRRFGPRVSRIGRLAALPFIALLVTPVPPGAGLSVLWSAVIALIVIAWVAAAGWAAEAAGFVPRPAPVPPPAAPPRQPGRRLIVSTRMALQMGVAIAVAFVAGRLVFPAHVPWVVITAYLVNAGNRGRGDVIHKAGQRLVGAAVGTIAATLLSSSFPAHAAVSVVAIFVVLAVATWWRPVSYMFWAGGVTGVLALLYGYYGDGGAAVLGERLAGIGVGAVIGVAAGALVVPVRTRDVVRRRVADALACIAAVLAAEPSERAEHRRRLAAAIEQLEQVAPALEAERRLLRRWRSTPFHADAIDVLRGSAARLGTDEPGPQGELDALAADVAAVRRRLAGLARDGQVPAAPAGSVGALHAWAAHHARAS